jgi:hypothetical protein
MKKLWCKWFGHKFRIIGSTTTERLEVCNCCQKARWIKYKDLIPKMENPPPPPKLKNDGI